MLIQDVHPGSILFLDCGCMGWKLVSPPKGPFLVLVERPCLEHLPEGAPQARYLEPETAVRPFLRGEQT